MLIIIIGLILLVLFLRHQLSELQGRYQRLQRVEQRQRKRLEKELRSLRDINRYRLDAEQRQLAEITKTTTLQRRNTRDYLLLRAELQNWQRKGTDQGKLEPLIKALDRRALSQLGPSTDTTPWETRRNEIWDRFVLTLADAPETPPWPKENKQEEYDLIFLEETSQQDPPPKDPSPKEPLQPAIQLALGPASAQAQVVPKIQTSPAPPPTQRIEPHPDTSKVLVDLEEAKRDSIWASLPLFSRLILHFAYQNIGWFLGIFCFLAGALFLVNHTSGFSKSLILYLIFTSSTLGLMWLGQHLRLKGEAYQVAGNVLLALGSLLIPLNLGAAARMFEPGMRPLVWWTWLLLVGLGLVLFAFALWRNCKRWEPALWDKYPWLYLGLSALQLGVPLFWQASPSHWHVLAIFHGLLLGLLGYGLVQHLKQPLFLQKHFRIAYFSVGALLYAALVSFLHLTLGSGPRIILPAGYFGPLLMLLCVLGWRVDYILRQWSERPTFLSHFSFVLYGLSVAALAMGMAHPVSRSWTLLVGILLYSLMTWQLLRPPPFYFLTGALAWLYFEQVLRPIHAAWWFLLSIPAILGLLWMGRWVRRAGGNVADRLVTVCYQTVAVLGLAVCAWTLTHSQAGWLPMSTALAASVLAYFALTRLPSGWFLRGQVGFGVQRDLSDTPWLYTLTFGGFLATCYAPILTSLQIGQWLLLWWWLAVLYTTAGLWGIRNSRVIRGQVFLNSANWTLVAAIFLVVCAYLFPQWLVLDWDQWVGLRPVGPELPDLRSVQLEPGGLITLLGGLGLVFFWQSLYLRYAILLYISLLCFGQAASLLRQTYFPGPTTGLGAILGALLCYALLGWSDCWKGTRQARPGLRLFACVPIPANGSSLKALLAVPLRLVIVVLWSMTLYRLATWPLSQDLSNQWVFSTWLAALVAALYLGRYQVRWLTPVVFGLGLTAWLGMLWRYGVIHPEVLAAATTLFALLVWLLGEQLRNRPLGAWLASLLHFPTTASALYEEWLHHLTVLVMLGALLFVLIGSPLFFVEAQPFTPFLALMVAIGFFGLAGRQRINRTHSFVVWALLTLLAVLGYSTVRSTPMPWLVLDTGLGVLLALLAIGLALLQAALPTNSIGYLYARPTRWTGTLLAALALLQSLILVGLPAKITQWPLVLIVMLVGGLWSLQGRLGVHPIRKLAGISSLLLAILWGQGLLLHGLIQPFPWWSTDTPVDLWFTLSILVLLGAWSTTKNKIPVPTSFHWAARLGWLWTVAGIAVAHIAWPGDPWLMVALLLLIPAAFAITVGWQVGSAARALVFGLFTTWTLLWLPFEQAMALWGQGGGIVWAFLLYLIACLVPYWNRHCGRYILAAEPLLWLGLGLVCNYALHHLTSTRPGPLALTTLYLFLMIPFRPILSWVACSLLALLGLQLGNVFLGTTFASPDTALAIAGILWGNLLFLVGGPWQRFLPLHKIGWQWTWLANPLGTVGLVTLSLWAVPALLINLIWLVLPSASFLEWLPHKPISALLAIVVLLWLLWRPKPLQIHLAILFGLNGLLAGFQALVLGREHLALVLALFSLLLLGLYRNRTSSLSRQALIPWFYLLPTGAFLAVWVIQPGVAERLIVLATLAIFSILHGWREQSRLWLGSAILLVAGLLHSLPGLWIGLDQSAWLLPWYALAMALLAGALVGLVEWLGRHPRQDEPARLSSRLLQELLAWGVPIIAGLASIEWIIHALSLNYLPGNSTTRTDGIAGLAAITLLFMIVLRATQQSSIWTYVTTFLALAAEVYGRLWLVGLSPANLWDTTLLIGTNIAILLFQAQSGSKPLLHVGIAMPLLALLTVPFELANPYTTGTLVMVAAIYHMVDRATQNPVPGHLALLALTLAAYLWTPGWAEKMDLIQLYLLPAAVMVLVVLHLHRHEVSRQVLNHTRLLALGVLYGSATLDVFLQDSRLGIFALAVGLSLLGCLLGMALRIRAFLYAGSSFLVLNVLAQLVRFTPQDQLGKGLLLVLLGILITTSMVVFSIKREAILSKIQRYGNELTNWE